MMLCLLRTTRHCFRAFNNVKYSVTVRSLATNVNKKTSLTSEVRNEEFTPIYKFPYIRALSLVNRLKLYQALATGAAIPSAMAMNAIGSIETEALAAVSIFGITCTAALFSIGYLTQHFIGFIYLNKSEDKVKFSYVDFWGRRKDTIFAINEVSPFSDLPVNFTDSLFYKLPFKTSEHSELDLKLNVRMGRIVNSDKFNKVFMPV